MDLEYFLYFNSNAPLPVTIKKTWDGLLIKRTLRLLFNMADKAAKGQEQ